MNAKELQNYYVTRIKFFVDKLENTNNPNDMEAALYTIGQLADRGQVKFQDLHKPDESPAGLSVE